MIKNLRIICQRVPVNHRGKGLPAQRISKIPGDKGEKDNINEPYLTIMVTHLISVQNKREDGSMVRYKT